MPVRRFSLPLCAMPRITSCTPSKKKDKVKMNTVSILYTLAVSPSLGGSRQHKRTTKTMQVLICSSSNDEGLGRVRVALLEQLSPSSPCLPQLTPLHKCQVISEEFHTEEGIPSPLAPSLLVTFHDT